MSTVDDQEHDAQEAPPWRPEHGPAPTVTTWPTTDRPALWIRYQGRQVYAPVTSRAQWPDGRVAYGVEVDDGTTSVSRRAFWWDPQAMRVAHRSRAQSAAQAAETGQGDKPRQRR